MHKEKLLWTTVQKKVNDLVPQVINPRKMSDKQMSDLKRSLSKFNLVEIPAIDYDGHILAGHMRIKALQLLGRGEELIDVRVPNRKLTDDEAKEYLIASNAITGDWDFSLLKDFNPEMLLDVGFNQNDLVNIWDNKIITKEENFVPEEEIKKIKETSIKLGDLILLGEHKIICGDSNDPEVIKKLFGDRKTSMIYQDPIYNISLDYNAGLGGKQNYGGNVIDKRTDDEYKEFLKRNLVNALSVAKPDCHVFYWNTEQHIWILQTLYRELGIDNKRVCLWIKNGQNPTPQVAFSKCYEPCIYGTRGKPFLSKKEQGLNEVFNKEMTTGNNLVDEVSSLWAVKRLSGKDYQHATSKPVDLHERAILRCTAPGDIILDSFMGSGSTLIACEQLKRVAYGIELEPIYCELIATRYEKLTGKKRVVLSDEKA